MHITSYVIYMDMDPWKPLTLLHTAQKDKCINMLENYYTQLLYD
jgi:hypothetical protein